MSTGNAGSVVEEDSSRKRRRAPSELTIDPAAGKKPKLESGEDPTAESFTPRAGPRLTGDRFLDLDPIPVEDLDTPKSASGRPLRRASKPARLQDTEPQFQQKPPGRKTPRGGRGGRGSAASTPRKGGRNSAASTPRGGSVPGARPVGRPRKHPLPAPQQGQAQQQHHRHHQAHPSQQQARGIDLTPTVPGVLPQPRGPADPLPTIFLANSPDDPGVPYDSSLIPVATSESQILPHAELFVRFKGPLDDVNSPISPVRIVNFPDLYTALHVVSWQNREWVTTKELAVGALNLPAYAVPQRLNAAGMRPVKCNDWGLRKTLDAFRCPYLPHIKHFVFLIPADEVLLAAHFATSSTSPALAPETYTAKKNAAQAALSINPHPEGYQPSSPRAAMIQSGASNTEPSSPPSARPAIAASNSGPPYSFADSLTKLSSEAWIPDTTKETLLSIAEVARAKGDDVAARDERIEALKETLPRAPPGTSIPPGLGPLHDVLDPPVDPDAIALAYPMYSVQAAIAALENPESLPADGGESDLNGFVPLPGPPPSVFAGDVGEVADAPEKRSSDGVDWEDTATNKLEAPKICVMALYSRDWKRGVHVLSWAGNRFAMLSEIASELFQMDPGQLLDQLNQQSLMGMLIHCQDEKVIEAASSIRHFRTSVMSDAPDAPQVLTLLYLTHIPRIMTALKMDPAKVLSWSQTTEQFFVATDKDAVIPRVPLPGPGEILPNPVAAKPAEPVANGPPSLLQGMLPDVALGASFHIVQLGGVNWVLVAEMNLTSPGQDVATALASQAPQFLSQCAEPGVLSLLQQAGIMMQPMLMLKLDDVPAALAHVKDQVQLGAPARALAEAQVAHQNSPETVSAPRVQFIVSRQLGSTMMPPPGPGGMPMGGMPPGAAPPGMAMQPVMVPDQNGQQQMMMMMMPMMPGGGPGMPPGMPPGMQPGLPPQPGMMPQGMPMGVPPPGLPGLPRMQPGAPPPLPGMQPGSMYPGMAPGMAQGMPLPAGTGYPGAPQSIYPPGKIQPPSARFTGGMSSPGGNQGGGSHHELDYEVGAPGAPSMPSVNDYRQIRRMGRPLGGGRSAAMEDRIWRGDRPGGAFSTVCIWFREMGHPGAGLHVLSWAGEYWVSVKEVSQNLLGIRDRLRTAIKANCPGSVTECLDPMVVRFLSALRSLARPTLPANGPAVQFLRLPELGGLMRAIRQPAPVQQYVEDIVRYFFDVVMPEFGDSLHDTNPVAYERMQAGPDGWNVFQDGFLPAPVGVPRLPQSARHPRLKSAPDGAPATRYSHVDPEGLPPSQDYPGPMRGDGHVTDIPHRVNRYGDPDGDPHQAPGTHFWKGESSAVRHPMTPNQYTSRERNFVPVNPSGQAPGGTTLDLAEGAVVYVTANRFDHVRWGLVRSVDAREAELTVYQPQGEAQTDGVLCIVLSPTSTVIKVSLEVIKVVKAYLNVSNGAMTVDLSQVREEANRDSRGDARPRGDSAVAQRAAAAALAAAAAAAADYGDGDATDDEDL